MAYSMLVDLDRCIGCYACEVACKQEHDIPVGPRWIRVVQNGPREVAGGLQLDYYPQMCKHCEYPDCAEVCAEEAIVRGEDGIVSIDPDRCTGCEACVPACPYGLMEFDRDAEKASKCDLCAARMQEGLEPSCVACCPGKALTFSENVSEGPRMMRLI